MADLVGATQDVPTVVGAPLAEDQVDYKAALAGFGPEKVVTIFNPLPNDFAFVHARSVTQNATLTPEQMETERKIGAPIRKDDLSPQLAHYAQRWILKAGESKNLPGDIAQKAVQDLVNYILMERAGKGRPKNVADGFARQQVEKEIILNTQDNVTFANSMPIPERTQTEVENLNPAPPLPEPAKEPETPAPGTGTNYEPAAKANK